MTLFVKPKILKISRNISISANCGLTHTSMWKVMVNVKLSTFCGLLVDNSNFSCGFIPIFRLFFTQYTQKSLYFTSFSVWIHLYTIPIVLFPLFPMLCKLIGFYPPFHSYTHVDKVENYPRNM